MARIKRDPDAVPIPDVIQAAATALFNKQGFDATNMRQISAAAGVTPGAIYYHFENKQEILYVGLLHAIEHLIGACSSALEVLEESAEVALQQFVTAHILFQLKELSEVAPQYSALVYGTKERENVLNPSQRKRLKSLERRHLDNLRTILDTGKKSGEFTIENTTVAAFSIIGMCEHTVNWAHSKKKGANQRVAKTLASYALKLVS